MKILEIHFVIIVIIISSGVYYSAYSFLCIISESATNFLKHISAFDIGIIEQNYV